MPPAVIVPNSEASKRFGAILKHRRLLKGMTQQDVSMNVGMSVSFISMVEQGQRVPTRSMAKHLLAVLDDRSARWSEEDEKLLTLVDPTNNQELEFIVFAKEDDKLPGQERVPTTLVRDEHIRLECIKAAARVMPGVHSSVTIQIAQEFEAYVKTGKPTPEEA